MVVAVNVRLDRCRKNQLLDKRPDMWEEKAQRRWSSNVNFNALGLGWSPVRFYWFQIIVDLKKMCIRAGWLPRVTELCCCDVRFFSRCSQVYCERDLNVKDTNMYKKRGRKQLHISESETQICLCCESHTSTENKDVLGAKNIQLYGNYYRQWIYSIIWQRADVRAVLLLVAEYSNVVQ